METHIMKHPVHLYFQLTLYLQLLEVTITSCENYKMCHLNQVRSAHSYRLHVKFQ